MERTKSVLESNNFKINPVLFGRKIQRSYRHGPAAIESYPQRIKDAIRDPERKLTVYSGNQDNRRLDEFKVALAKQR